MPGEQAQIVLEASNASTVDVPSVNVRLFQRLCLVGTNGHRLNKVCHGNGDGDGGDGDGGDGDDNDGDGDDTFVYRST